MESKFFMSVTLLIIGCEKETVKINSSIGCSQPTFLVL
jgi:hypothetical protein